MSTESRPGVRLNIHPPDHMWAWVFRQHQVWVDRHGSEHEIESMDTQYVENVIRFCRERAAQIHALVYVERVGEAVTLMLRGGSAEDAQGSLEDAPDPDADPEGWLETTPLMLALRRRLT